MAEPTVVYKPHPGPQTQFLKLTCFEALFGGAAGGSKSNSLVIDAIRYVGRGYGAAYAALLLRRTHPELERSILTETRKWYPYLNGKWNDQKHVWTFPDGERVYLGHCQHEHDVHDYQGAEFSYVGFDEATTFLESQYLYLMSRIRSTRGIKVRMRATANPGGEGHEWVFRRWGCWLNPEAEQRAEPGKVLYFAPTESGEQVVSKGTPLSSGRTFIPSRLEDNPSLKGGEYEKALAQLDPVTRAQLRDGNWTIRPSKGAYMKRAWLHTIDGKTPCIRCREVHPLPTKWKRRVRYWDRAATEAKQGSDPDWTVGARLMETEPGYLGPRYVLDDVVRLQGTSKTVESTIRATCVLDTKATQVCLEEDPGQAGKFEIAYYVNALSGFRVTAHRVMRDKVQRYGPVSSQAEHGNVGIIVGPKWVEPFVQEQEAFPEGGHDDQCDAFSGAFSVLAEPPQARGVIGAGSEWLLV